MRDRGTYTGLTVLAILILPVGSAIANGQNVDAVLRGLASKDPHVRHATLDDRENWKPGSPRAIPLLVQIAVNDSDYGTRGSAWSCLQGLGPPARAAVPALIAALKSPREKQRANAVQALDALGPLAGDAVDAIAATYADTSRFVKFVAGEALRSIHHPTAASVAALVGELHDSYSPGALNASLALGALGEVAINPLRPCLADPKVWVRMYAVYALQEIGGPATGALRDAYLDNNAAVRGAALMGLGRISPRTEVIGESLKHGTDDPDPELRELARSLLAYVPTPAKQPAPGAKSH